MRAIRNKNTQPELLVRKLLFSLGYRYRLHQRGLPGKPDVVFSSRRAVIFVHGCFWHQHDCGSARLPKSNEDYWAEKLQKNVERDSKNSAALKAHGWKVMVIWDCECKDLEALKGKLVSFLESS